MNDADIIREFFDDAENAERLHGFVLPMSAPRAALDRLVNERDEAREVLEGSHARGYREGVREAEARAEAALQDSYVMTHPTAKHRAVSVQRTLAVDALKERAESAEAALRDAQTERDEARDKVLTHTEALLALTGERDRWRAIACNVKDGTAAAEAQVQQLKAALAGVRDRDRVGEVVIGPCFCPDWEVECWDLSSSPDEFVHHPVCAIARAALADLAEDTP